MGKYDGLVKYLGKEDSFSPDQIIKGMEIQEKMDDLNDLTNVPLENMANVEKLIGAEKQVSTQSAPAPDETDVSEIDPDVLKEIENLDTAPSNVEELKSRIQVTNYDKPLTPAEELSFLEQETAETPVIEEEAGGESTPENILEPQFMQMPSGEETPLPEEELKEQEPEKKEFPGEEMPEFVPSSAEMQEPELTDFFQDLSVKEETPEEAGTVLETAFPDNVENPQEEAFPEIGLPETAIEETAEFPNLEIPEMEKPVEKPSSETEMPDLGSTEMELPEFEMPKFEAAGSNLPEFEAPIETKEGMKQPLSENVEAPEEFPPAEIHEFADISKQMESFQQQKPIEKPSFLESPKEKTPIKFAAESGGIELDQEKAAKVRSRINKIVNPLLRKKIRQAILEAKLPDHILQQLIAFLILNAEDDEIQAFIDPLIPDTKVIEIEQMVKKEKEKEIETKKKKTTEEFKGAGIPGRKIIYTEEIHKGKEFTKEFQNVTKYSFVFFIIIILLGFIFWQIIWTPAIANRYYSQGLAALKRNDFISSESKFEIAKRTAGPNLKWFNIFANSYIEKKQFDMAKKKFIDALDYNPMDQETIYNFADYYKIIYPPRFDEAIKLYGRLLKKSPKNFDYIDKVAMTYIDWADRTTDPNDQIARYAEANKLYEGYLTYYPKHTASYFRLLDIALRLKKEDRIDILYDTIDHINNKAVNVKTMTELAKFYTDRRRLDRAKLVFNKLIPPNPQYDEAYYEYARYLTINYDFFRAIKAISNAIILNGKSAKSYNLLGEIYFVTEVIQNNIILAKEQFENAIKYDPNYYKPYANLGHIYYYNSLNFNDPEKAYSDAFYNYKMAMSLIDKDKKDYLLSYNLGWLYYKYKDYENAFNEFAKLYVDEPYDPVLSYVLGNTYYYLNKLNLAKVQYDKAIEYYRVIAGKVQYINPGLQRHKEIYTQLARSFNNRGVVYSLFAKQTRNPEYEQRALLDFYQSKEYANKINVIYNFSEYNIKYLLNKNIRNDNPAFDDELTKRTTLTKLIDEFKDNMISTL